MSTPTSPAAEFAQRCINNARALLSSADAVMQLEHFDVAYHLAVLSLEEVGKASMIMCDAIKTDADREGKDSFIAEKIEDHTFKLLWAFWTVDRGSKRILPETFQEAMDLAKHVHKTRTATLYTSQKLTAQIDKEAATNVLNLARSRLEMDNSLALQNVPKEGIEDLAWFIEAIKDPYNKARIFSKEYFEKFAEIQQIHLWILWIKQQFSADDSKMKALILHEVNRGEPSEDERFKPKWKVRFKLVMTGVSTLNQQAFNIWNKQNPRVQFTVENSKAGKIIVDLILPKLVHINQVHDVIRQEMIRIILTLSIGTMSFYWWYNLLAHIQKFEYFEDLENNTRSPYGLKNPYMDVWEEKEKKRAMTDQNIQHMLWCYFMLPRFGEEVSRKPYSYYLQGLLDYSKHEAEEPRIGRAGIAFLASLEAAMIENKEISSRTEVNEAFFRNFGELLTDEDDQVQFRSVLAPYSLGNDAECYKAMKADTATKMKIFCDMYFLQNFKKELPKRLQEIETDG